MAQETKTDDDGVKPVASGEPKFAGLWVKEVMGRPYVRWTNVGLYLLAMFSVQTLVGALISWWQKMPMNLGPIVIPLFGMMGYLVVVVELQRQRVLMGELRLRLGLGAMLICMTLFCMFAAVMAHTIRQTQEWHATNLELKERLEAVMQDGKAYMGTVNGRSITCQVQRASFSDEDLEQLIRIATHGRTRRSELTAAFLGETKVTTVGVEKLAADGRLTLLDLPAIPLSDAAVDALAGCSELQFLFLDEKMLSPEQLARLRQALPRLKLNGKDWQ